MANALRIFESDPRVVIVNGKRIRADHEATPIGVYDVIRDDLRKLSTVQPVNRAFIERTDSGYRGVLYSHEKPYLFSLNGVGFVSKPMLDEDTAILRYCAKLEEHEQKLTASMDANRSDHEQQEFNDEMAIGSPDEPSMTAQSEDAPPDTLKMYGPSGADYVERIPDSYRKMMQGASFVAREGKQDNGVCGGAVVMKQGKILLVKPTNGWGGYDWTFPKGYPLKSEKLRTMTAVRETQEETGYVVFANRFLGRFHHNDGGTCDYFICDVDSSKPQGPYDTAETEAVKWVTLVEALTLLNDDVDIKILSQANNLAPQLLIKGGHTGTMIALQLPKKIAKQVALKGGEPVESMHITLAYLGKTLSEKQKKATALAVRKFGQGCSGIKVTLGGVGRFSASETSEGKDVIYISVDSPQLTRVRRVLEEYLADGGVLVNQAHGFVPHVTLAYIAKTDKTPLARFEPIDVSFDSIQLAIGGKKMAFPLKLSKENQDFVDAGKRNYEALQKWVVKALPKGGEEKPVAKTPIGKASAKTPGAGGKMRYDYPGEKGGEKKPQPGKPQAQEKPGAPQGAQPSGEGGPKNEVGVDLPHPDTPPPQPEQDPIAQPHPEKPDPQDVRAQDPTKPQPKHTLNVGELCSALQIDRNVLMQVVQRMQKMFGNDARGKFSSFLMTHLKEFVHEHGLDGDYFALLYDVLTGAVIEGQPISVIEAAQKPTQTQPSSASATAV